MPAARRCPSPGLPTPGAHGQGFTLVEMLVVVVIIGIVIAGALLSLGTIGRDTQLERERDRLDSLIDYVRERAALQTVEYGLRCQQDGYQFVEFDTRREQWVEDPLDDTLRARALPAGIGLQLAVEGRPIVLPLRSATSSGSAMGAGTAASASGTPGEQALAPQVMLYSSGELTVFRLVLARTGGPATTISADASGTVRAGELVAAQP